MKRLFTALSITLFIVFFSSATAWADSYDEAFIEEDETILCAFSEDDDEGDNGLDLYDNDSQIEPILDDACDATDYEKDSESNLSDNQNQPLDIESDPSGLDLDSTSENPELVENSLDSEIESSTQSGSDSNSDPISNPNPDLSLEPEPSASAIPDGIYVIRSLNADREVLDVTGKSTKAGANVETWSSNGGGNQKWEVTHDETGTFTLRSILSGMLLDISGAKSVSGTNVIQYPDNGGANQRWRIIDSDRGFLIASALSDDLVLDISGAKKTDGGNIIVFTPNGGANQLWEFVRIPDSVEPGAIVDEGWYRIEFSDGIVLDVSGNSTNNGANIELWSENSGNNQAFYISCDDGYATIATGTCGWVSSTGADPIPGSNIIQSNTQSSDSQRFALEDVGNGLWRFRNVSNGFYLSAESCETGMNVYSSTEGIAFSLVPITSFIENEGPYRIIPAHAQSKIVESVDPNPSAGMNIDIASSYGSLHQKWFVEKVPDLDNTYIIRSSASGLVLSASGRTVSLEHEIEESEAQRWIVRPSGPFWVFENISTGTVLDVTGKSTKDGASIGIWTQNGGNNQSFKLTPTALFENGSVVTISLGDNIDEVVDVNGSSKSNGASVTLWHENGGANQRWRLTDLGNGLYRLTNVNSGRLLTLSSSGMLTQQSSTNGAVQQWFFQYDRSDGTVSILSGSGDLLPLYASGSSNGSSISVRPDSDSSTPFRINVQFPYGQTLDSASSAQKRLVTLAWKEPTTPAGYCAMWVHNVFEAYGIYDVYGNANDLYDNYCTSSSLYDLKVGMIVAVSRHPGTSGGRIYGHIGIYVGDGIMLDSSGSVRVWNVEDWINSYNGWVTPKWGWYGNRKLG